MPPNSKPPQSADHSALFDALAFAQAPQTANQLTDLLVAAGLRTARGSAFHNAEVRRLLDELAEGILGGQDGGRVVNAWELMASLRGDTEGD